MVYSLRPSLKYGLWNIECLLTLVQHPPHCHTFNLYFLARQIPYHPFDHRSLSAGGIANSKLADKLTWKINCKWLGTWGPTCRIPAHFARLYSHLRLDFFQLLLVLGEPVEDA